MSTTSTRGVRRRMGRAGTRRRGDGMTRTRRCLPWTARLCRARRRCVMIRHSSPGRPWTSIVSRRGVRRPKRVRQAAHTRCPLALSHPRPLALSPSCRQAAGSTRPMARARPTCTCRPTRATLSPRALLEAMTAASASASTHTACRAPICRARGRLQRGRPGQGPAGAATPRPSPAEATERGGRNARATCVAHSACKCLELASSDALARHGHCCGSPVAQYIAQRVQVRSQPRRTNHARKELRGASISRHKIRDLTSVRCVGAGSSWADRHICPKLRATFGAFVYSGYWKWAIRPTKEFLTSYNSTATAYR